VQANQHKYHPHQKVNLFSLLVWGLNVCLPC